MKWIIAIIQPHRLEAVKQCLTEVEVFRLTVSDVQGYGRQKGHTEYFRGQPMQVNLIRKVRLDIGVNDNFVQPTINAIVKGARSGEGGKGQVGDGKCFVIPLESVIRVSDGVQGSDAILKTGSWRLFRGYPQPKQPSAAHDGFFSPFPRPYRPSLASQKPFPLCFCHGQNNQTQVPPHATPNRKSSSPMLLNSCPAAYPPWYAPLSKSVGMSAVFIKEGKAAQLTDVDNNTYIDYVMSYGPLIAGHAPPTVRAAVAKQIDKGSSYGCCSETEIKLAAAIAKAMPNVPMVRFVNSGTEATMSAVRLARGAPNAT